MNVKISNVTIDCTDLDGTVRFWSELLGLKVTSTDESWVDLEPLGGDGPTLSFQKVPEAKATKNRIHLDLEVPDLAAATERAAGLGAVPAKDVYDGTGFEVWRDPEGNEFCLVPQ